jgi:DNA primase
MSVDIGALRNALSDPFALASALGLAGIRRQARGVTVCCPWHNERSPSCSITVGPDGTIRAKCFGCSATGDVLAIVAAVHGLDTHTDFPEVLRVAEGIAGGTYSKIQERALPPEPPRLADEIFERIAGCTDALAGPTLEYAIERLPGADLTELRAIPRRFEARAIAAVGSIAWERSGLSSPHGLAFPANILAIPWCRPDGVVQTLQRRRLTPGEPKYVFPRARSPRYPFGVERMAMIGPAASVVFVEGAFDTIALRVIAARNGLECVVLGLPGVGAWDRTWSTYAVGRTAVIALDNDAAGDERAIAMAADLRAAGATGTRRLRPRGHDWSDDLHSEARS